MHRAADRGRALLVAAIIGLALALAACSGKPRTPEIERSEGRTGGQVWRDQYLEYAVKQAIRRDPAWGSEDHVNVEAYNGVVLLVGEVSSADERDRYGALAQQQERVRRVVNELAVGDRASWWSRSDNTLDDLRINTALLAGDDIEGFDPGRVKVVVARDIVYLMGLVSRAEARQISDRVRNVGGVERVVLVFDYTD